MRHGDEDDFLLEDDVPSGVADAASPWMVLVVDDDASVHSITRLVLGDVRFQGRGIDILSAHSGREAARILRNCPDIALILLDVVMESDDSGLRLVREVRESMGNKAVRIILRTGDPGQAPERRVILDYDINDYKAKADLTAQQLYTATIAALRSHADIVALEASRAALLAEQAALERRVVERTAELAEANRALRASQALLEEDLRAAATLQQAILPDAFPPHPHIDGAALMRSARAIGGDFHDAVALDASRMALLVADVSGKGAQAALFMVLVRTLLQEVVTQHAGTADLDPAAIMAETNRRLLARNPLSLFVTVMFGVLDAAGGRFAFCSAGHGMPLIRRADGSVERVAGRPSPMLGLIETAQYRSQDVILAPGDAVVLVTDGIEEATDAHGTWFGEKRLCTALTEAGPNASAAALLEATLRAVDDFSGGAPLGDDITCVVARWTP
jgi:serine phosphatase RsbU (regulator of sigma subunit)